MARLSAGASSTVMTPPVGSYMAAWGLRKGRSKGVHDDLKARALVLDDGEERVAFVSLDVCYVYASLTSEIRRRVTELTGIKASRVMVSASHTHTSPVMGGNISVWEDQGDSQYLRVFPEYVAGTVAAAAENVQPALVSSSSSELGGITINRRHPEQPVDAVINVLRVSGRSGQAIAHLMNFGCHPVTVGGQYLVWSADFPGAACSFVECSVPGSVCLYANGASGDIHPWDMYFGNEHPRFGNTLEAAERLGRTIGSETVRLSECMRKQTGSVRIRASSRSVRFKKRRMPSQGEAEMVRESIQARHEPWTADTWETGDTVSNIFRRHPSQYLLSSAARLLELSKSGEKEISTEMQAFGLGGIALVSIPGELFSNLGIELRKRSGAQQTFIMGYSNDEIGYIPTVEAIEECENLGPEEGFGLKYTYGATLPVTTISKEGVVGLVSKGVEMASSVSVRGV